MGITAELAAFAVNSCFDSLPSQVQAESARAFSNWLGCVFGGSHEITVKNAVSCIDEIGGKPKASLIGHNRKTDIINASFINCLSSSALAYDDTHLTTVTHPTGPVAAAIFAYSEKERISGEDFLSALAVGIEIQCRLSNVLLMAPAESNLGFYITGLTGPIGTAAALGRLLRLDEQKMRWAIGLAATQGAGFRATHGTMAGAFVPAIAARNGAMAALLAAKGFTCSESSLEANKGFVDVFSTGADFNYAVEGLGKTFEVLANAYKPYPCGIVIHATIDACLEIATSLPLDECYKEVLLTVNPLTLTLTDRRQPADMFEAQVSLYHWAAVSLLHRSAGISELSDTCIKDSCITRLREKIRVVADPSLQRDEAKAQVLLENGRVITSHIEKARGGFLNPMTNDELEMKLKEQASVHLSPTSLDVVLDRLRNIADLKDVGGQIVSSFAK